MQSIQAHYAILQFTSRYLVSPILYLIPPIRYLRSVIGYFISLIRYLSDASSLLLETEVVNLPFGFGTSSLLVRLLQE